MFAAIFRVLLLIGVYILLGNPPFPLKHWAVSRRAAQCSCAKALYPPPEYSA